MAILIRPWMFLMLLLSVSAAFEKKKHPVSSPTMAPTNATVETPVPSATPATKNTTTIAPSPAPHTTVAPNVTIAPTPSHNVTTPSPSIAPSHSPTTAPAQSTNDDNNKHHWSFWSILAKTIAWSIIILLVFLGFGAFMSNRYRIYYFLRGIWYTILGMDCTQRILRKLTGRGSVDSGLNTIIFEDNPDMSEGLLLRETD
jgi:hypothetical protein